MQAKVGMRAAGQGSHAGGRVLDPRGCPQLESSPAASLDAAGTQHWRLKMTDIMQALVDGLGAQWMRDRAETQMTFGELIERLGQLPPDTPIAAGEPDSYRGYYSDVALDPTEESTAGELLAKCREMMGRTMTGYKGGEYPVHENVPVWVSPYGECSGDKLISIGDDGTLNTEEEE